MTTILTFFQSMPPSGLRAGGSSAGLKINRQGWSKSRESWPLRSPVNSWQRPGSVFISSRQVAAVKSSSRCLIFFARISPCHLRNNFMLLHSSSRFLSAKRMINDIPPYGAVLRKLLTGRVNIIIQLCIEKCKPELEDMFGTLTVLPYKPVKLFLYVFAPATFRL